MPWGRGAAVSGNREGEINMLFALFAQAAQNSNGGAFNPIDLVDKAPAIAALIAVVMLFLRHISSMERRWSQQEEERNAALTKLGEGCHAFQQRLQDQEDARSSKIVEALTRGADVMSRNEMALTRIESILDKKQGAR